MKGKKHYQFISFGAVIDTAYCTYQEAIELRKKIAKDAQLLEEQICISEHLNN